MWKRFFKRERKVEKKKSVGLEDVILDISRTREKIFQDRKIELPLSYKTFSKFLFLVFFIFGCFWLDVVYLQFVKGSFYQQKAFDNKSRIQLIRPQRGIFYDLSGKQLVWNRSSFDLVCDKRDMPFNKEKKNLIFKSLAKLLKVQEKEIQELFDQTPSYKVLLKENVDEDLLINFSLKSKFLKGCYLERNEIRYYPEKDLLSHVLGYLAKIEPKELKEKKDYSISDYIGRAGLEKSYEDILRGQVGKVVIEKDSLGRKRKEYQIQSPENGKSLKLWIDSALQKKAAEALQKSLNNVGSPAGAVVILNAKTGGVLSLVSLPTYDDNLFSQGINYGDYQRLLSDKRRPLFNRAIAGLYPSGSTIKPLIASAALQEGVINKNTTIHCKGEISVPNPYNPKIVYHFRDWKVHGVTDLKKAIAESCNVFFYIVGGGYKDFKGLGAKKIAKYLHLFNWGRKTGIDLPGEKKGLVPTPEWKESYKKKPWYPGDTYHLSIGQGDILVTPIQVATSFASIANGGILYRPHLVKEIIDSKSKKVVREIKPEIIRKDFIDRKYLEEVREGMRQAVTSPSGSSHMLNDLAVKVAAKTGTAQFGVKRKYHSWITVFAPYENPEIVITVLVENVPEGKIAAIPVAKEILKWYFSRGKAD